MASLDDPLTADQQRLLTILAATFRTHREWPNWRWLRRQLDYGPRAEQLLTDLPRLGRRYGIYGHVYGLVWTNEPAGTAQPMDETVVALTVAGLHRAGSKELVDDYLRVLRAAVSASEAFQPSRTVVERPHFGEAQVARLDGLSATLTGIAGHELLTHEPPFWGHGWSRPTDGGWYFQLDDHIERYASVRTVDDYFAAVARQLDEDNAGYDALFSAPAPPPAKPWWRRSAIWIGGAVTVGLGGGITAVASDLVQAAATSVAGWLRRLFGG